MNKKTTKIAAITLSIGLFSGAAYADWRNYLPKIESKSLKIGLGIGGIVAAKAAATAVKYAWSKRKEKQLLKGLIAKVKTLFDNPKQLSQYRAYPNPLMIKEDPFQIRIFKSGNEYKISIWRKRTFTQNLIVLIFPYQLETIAKTLLYDVYIKIKPKEMEQSISYLINKSLYVDLFPEDKFFTERELEQIKNKLEK